MKKKNREYIDSLKDEIDDLTNDVAKLQNKIVFYDENKTALYEQIESLEAKLKRKSEANEELTEDLCHAKEAAAKVSRDLQHCQKRNRGLKEKEHHLFDENARLNGLAEEQLGHIEMLDESIDELTDKLGLLKNEKQRATACVKQLEIRLEHSQDHVRDLESCNENLKIKLNASKENIEPDLKHANELKFRDNRIKELTRANDIYFKANDIYFNANKNHIKTLGLQRNRIEVLETELNVFKERLEKVKKDKAIYIKNAEKYAIKLDSISGLLSALKHKEMVYRQAVKNVNDFDFG